MQQREKNQRSLHATTRLNLELRGEEKKPQAKEQTLYGPLI